MNIKSNTNNYDATAKTLTVTVVIEDVEPGKEMEALALLEKCEKKDKKDEKEKEEKRARRADAGRNL